jgi:hypothetical protein
MMNNATPWNRLYNLGKPSIASGAAALAMALTALVVPASTFSAQADNICAIQTVNGHYLTAVDSGGRTSDVIHTDATQIQAWEKFTLVPVPGNPYYIALKALDGHYLTAVGGGGRNTDVIHSNATQIGVWEKFSLDILGDPNPEGFYSLRTVDRHYLSAVGGGGYGSGFQDVIHSDATRIGNWEKFRLAGCTSTD